MSTYWLSVERQDLCKKYDIPTAKYEVFSNAEKAKAYIKEQAVPIVVKADGLAAGKGVIVAASTEEACSAVDDMLVNKAFGSAGQWALVALSSQQQAGCCICCLMIHCVWCCDCLVWHFFAVLCLD